MEKDKRKAILLNHFGFTMTELMVSVGIFTILVAIAAPNMVANIPAMRLNGAARQVLGDLMWARAKAVNENNQFVVTFPNNTSYTLLDDDNNNGSANGGEWTKTQNIQTNFTDVTLAKSGGDPTFSPRGTAAGATTITLTNSSGTRTVTVSITGNVKIN
jgi:type IV fimbrial biogenesis protein FimT